MSGSTFLILVVVYRLIPFGVTTVTATQAMFEALRRGVIPDEAQSLVEQSRNACDELWPRFCLRQWPWTQNAVLGLIDSEVCRIWPWLWPMWIGPQIVMHRRMWSRTIDRRWRA